MNIKRTRHAAYNINYHFVWIPKYRRKVLIGGIPGRLIELLTELSRLGRSTGQVINLIDELMSREVRVIIIKENLDLDKNQDDIQSVTMITLLSLFAQLERMMISRRTKEALAVKKAQGIPLGKP